MPNCYDFVANSSFRGVLLISFDGFLFREKNHLSILAIGMSIINVTTVAQTDVAPIMYKNIRVYGKSISYLFKMSVSKHGVWIQIANIHLQMRMSKIPVHFVTKFSSTFARLRLLHSLFVPMAATGIVIKTN